MKSKVYLENYWMLFLDFINQFHHLTYKGIPLPLLANFYQYLDDSIIKSLEQSEFKQMLSIENLPVNQIQPNFEKWIHLYNKIKSGQSVKGKILLNFDYLRFSKDNYIKYFNPANTVILAKWKKDSYASLPVNCIKDYNIDVKADVIKLTKSAEKAFSKVSSHEVYSNLFFKTSFMNMIKPMIESIASVENYLSKNQISCIIVGTTEEIISRILTISGAKRGIPSICMQHGLIGGEEAFMPVFSTIAAVYGQYEKNWYLTRGLSEQRIAITGHPKYDDIILQQHLPKEAFYKKYQLSPQKKTILFATQPGYFPLWNELTKIMAQNDEYKIIMKPHPWELSRKPLINDYINLQNKYQSIKLIIDKRIPVYEILPNVDLVVSNISTIGLETMLFDKPLFILYDTNFDYYDGMKGYIYSDPLKLSIAISKLLNDKSESKIFKKTREDFLSYVYPQKSSGCLLIDVINKLIEGE